MRIAIAAFTLESVSFLPLLTDVEDFESVALRGAGMLEALRGTASVGGGFIQVLEEAGAEIAGLVYADTFAAGSASDAAFDKYAAEICGGLAAEKDRLDGVLLFLHGAMTTPTRTDPEGDLLRMIRAAIGDALPVVVAMDLHANVDASIVETATAVFGYHYSPHIDMAETGARAARCLLGLLIGDIAPVTAVAKVPVALPSIFTATAVAPLADIVAAGFAWEDGEENVLDVSVFCGFAYADVPQIGFSVVVVADGDMDLAQRVADNLADRVWKARHSLLHRDKVLTVADGVTRALANRSAKPVVLLEHADRLSDSTYTLRELLERGATNAAVPYLWDAEAARAAIEAGEGATVTLDVGGHSSERTGGPVRLIGKVLFAGDKSYIGTGPMREGRRIDLGPTAVIDAAGIVVSITSIATPAIDADPFIQFGLDARDFGIIVLRSKTHFRAVYEDLAEEILIVDTPDWGPADLTTLPFRNVGPGVFPITSGE